MREGAYAQYMEICLTTITETLNHEFGNGRQTNIGNEEIRSVVYTYNTGSYNTLATIIIL